jgi:hypothetical protein
MTNALLLALVVIPVVAVWAYALLLAWRRR